MRYDASKAPDPQEWLELDESDRIDLVKRYHIRAKLPVGENERLHAAAHVIVENQVAMGDATVVPATLARLMREGLDRHDAIHAIGSVLVGIFFDVAKDPSKQTTRRMAGSSASFRRKLAVAVTDVRGGAAGGA
jgi:hypothetical protein